MKFVSKLFKRFIKFVDNITANQIRFVMWFIVGLTGVFLSPFMKTLIEGFLSFVFGAIILIWSFSWLYE